MPNLDGWILLYLTFYVVVALHEIGHLVAAKILRMPVKTIAVGLFSVLSFNIGEVEVKLGLVPLFGYVLPKNDIYNHSWPKRLFFVAAGPLASLFVPYIIIFLLGGFEAVTQLSIFVWEILMDPQVDLPGQRTESFFKSSATTLSGNLEQVGLYLTAFSTFIALSLFMGFLNLIPIPIFDGGRIILILLEGLFGKGVQKIANVLYIISAGLLLILFIVDMVIEITLLTGK